MGPAKEDCAWAFPLLSTSGKGQLIYYIAKPAANLERLKTSLFDIIWTVLYRQYLENEEIVMCFTGASLVGFGVGVDGGKVVPYLTERENPPHSAPVKCSGPEWLAEFLGLLSEPCVKYRPMCVSTPGEKSCM